MGMRATTTEGPYRTQLLLGLAAGLLALGCTGPDAFNHNTDASMLVSCIVNRQECAQVDLATKTCLVTTEDVRSVSGDICIVPPFQVDATAICQSAFCTNDINAPGMCDVFSAHATDGAAACHTIFSGPNATQIVSAEVHDVRPDTDAGPVTPGTKIFNTKTTDGVLPGSVFDPPICVPSGVQPITWIAPASGTYSGAVSLGQVIPNSPKCAAPSQPIVFAFTAAAPLATASGAGTTASITAVRGHARVTESCFGEICVLQSLDDLQADLADTTVAGVPLTRLRVMSVLGAPLTQITPPDSPAFTGVAPGGLRLRLEGQMNGVDSVFRLVSTSPFRVDVTSAFRLRGTFLLDGLGPNGTSLPITVTVDASAPPATPQDTTCAVESSLDRLFGFEDVQSWTSTAASLSLVTAPVRQGCGALGVAGQGYMPIVGAPFTTRGLATNTALSVDLFIPKGQPNPSWLGTLQMYLTCPSASVFNQYIGQVELTGKPVGQYSTLRFPLPSATRTTLGQPIDDCSFSFALNVNATGNKWLLDKLRFTP